ncbi:hypothetical protein [Bifidobacterium saguinibicoloris]|uniref:hypothetical protein n=1 Tax=Bifidobacterium saguinibicoloris TaxID=2834433 RepID=UPI001C58DAAB|nr:hypothetical protein [Bifidobacterium saguinibicoloris]MBW3079879.1 hypothetical protein [Bifidobacterium saguinibicoloris]
MDEIHSDSSQGAEGNSLNSVSSGNVANHSSEYTGDLIRDLGDRLGLDTDLYRRCIRGISWSWLMAVLSVALIAIGAASNNSENDFLHELSIALGCFFLGLLVSPTERLNKWIQRVNRIMESTHGSMCIVQAMAASLDDDHKVVYPTGLRIGAKPLRRCWMRFRFPHAVRRWRRFFRAGTSCLQLELPPFVGVDPIKASHRLRHPLYALEDLCNRFYDWRRRRLLYQVSRYIYELDPSPSTLDYLVRYSDGFLTQKYETKISRGVVAFH